MTAQHLSNAVDDMAAFFEHSVETNGVEVDAELCGVFAEALRELQKTLNACERYMAAQGAVIRALQEPSVQLPVAGNVVWFPRRPPPARPRDGGDAA